SLMWANVTAALSAARAAGTRPTQPRTASAVTIQEVRDTGKLLSRLKDAACGRAAGPERPSCDSSSTPAVAVFHEPPGQQSIGPVGFLLAQPGKENVAQANIEA